MSYTTHFLKFPDQDVFDAVASEVGYKFTREAQLDEDGNVIFPSSTFYSTNEVSGPGAIDLVGTIYNNDAVYEGFDDQGMPIFISPATPIDGYHVNICLRTDALLPLQFSQYIVSPAPVTPFRTFG